MLCSTTTVFGADALDEVAHAKAIWDSHHFHEYTFVLLQSLPITVSGRDSAIFSPIRIVIKNGKRVRATVVANSPGADNSHVVPRTIRKYIPRNMEEVFHRVSDALMNFSGKREIINVSFDPVYGFPSKFSYVSSNTLDTDESFEINSFEATK
jgi:hypothetical protein